MKVSSGRSCEIHLYSAWMNTEIVERVEVRTDTGIEIDLASDSIIL